MGSHKWFAFLPTFMGKLRLASRTPIELIDQNGTSVESALPPSSQPFRDCNDPGRCEKTINRGNWGKYHLSLSLSHSSPSPSSPQLMSQKCPRCVFGKGERSGTSFMGVGPAQSLRALAFTILKFLPIFEQGASHLHFAMGPPNSVQSQKLELIRTILQGKAGLGLTLTWALPWCWLNSFQSSSFSSQVHPMLEQRDLELTDVGLGEKKVTVLLN